MGNLIGCFVGYNTKEHDKLSPPLSSGKPGRNTSGQGFSSETTTTAATPTSSSTGNSGYSFGDDPSFGETLPLSGELLERPNLRVFSFAELKSATRGFRNDTVLGQGGFGKVYRGYIDDNLVVPCKITVAIKKLNSESLQGFEEWQHDKLSPPLSSGKPGRNTSGQGFSSETTTTAATPTSSSTGNSGYSFGDDPSFGETLPLSGELLEKPNLRVFSFAELKSATRGFRNDTVLGQGGFGKVYRGYIDDNLVAPSKLTVAIKKLNSESLQGFEEWQSEVNFLGRLSHPNLVKLLGYCWEDQELLLVYEYLSKGSLENHLFRRMSSVEPLSWERRLSIISGVAKGLAFLHTSDRQVIYRDFKAANILLDSDYNAKLSDFGMAKLGPSGENSHVTTRVMGTHGYAAPEYVTTGHLYVNSDVYGFGVVLLEILTGLRALDLNRPNGQQNLVDRVKPCLSNKRRLRTIMDVRLQGKYSLKAAFELAQLTLKCLVSDPKARPCMKDVVEVLEKAEAIIEKPQQKKNRTLSSTNTQQSNHNRRSGYHRNGVANPDNLVSFTH